MSTEVDIEDLLRRVAPQVLGVLIRHHGQVDACEDAVQEALLAAAIQWPDQGVPGQPTAWLVTVAGRRLTDMWRSEHARHRREDAVTAQIPSHEQLVRASDEDDAARYDDTLTMLLLCCHPTLTRASQVALTLRIVGELTTAQIARALLVSESTMAQRISRAKQSVVAAGATFRLPSRDERADRLAAVLHVLYLIFNEGYTATSGPDLQRVELTAEAIRLTRALHGAIPHHGEVTGLLALMLLTNARHAARCGPDGDLVPLAEQNRDLWDRDAIAEGVELVSRTLATSALGEYQIQAAIAAIHAEARSIEDTDWRQIHVLYRILDRIAPNPIVTLNRAVATAMVHGPQAGLDLLAGIEDDKRTAGHHRVDAVRAHLLEMNEDPAAAREHYERAARRATSGPEQRYLLAQAARLAARVEPHTP